MEVYYENSDKLKKLDFNGGRYEIADIDVFRHEFQYNHENDKITEFKRGIQTYTIEANITDEKEKDWQDSYDEMNEIFENDIWSKKPGKLYVNGWYMKCYVYSSKPQEIFENWGFQTTELKIVTDDSRWIGEQHITIPAISKIQTMAVNNTKKYPYTYPYRYADVYKNKKVNIDHYAESDFRMIAYGPTANVNVSINGHKYHVDYPIESGEYMVIDSRDYLPPDERIYLVKNNGEKINVFNYRDPEQSVFQKISPGYATIYYSQNYGIDLTIFKERSEPKWKK